MTPMRYDRGLVGATITKSSSQKTGRTHEENRERAYIAASRRTDRSVEARVRSAQMASKIHKKRTGRALQITRDKVMGDEMYEEEEIRFPRPNRSRAFHTKISTAKMTTRADVYPANGKFLSEKEWRENEINREFAKTFPNAYQGLLGQRASSGLSDLLPNWSDGFCVSLESPFKRTSARGHSPAVTTSSMLGMNADHQSLPPLTLTSESGSVPDTPHSSVDPAVDNRSSLTWFGHNVYDSFSFTTVVALEANTLITDIGQGGKVDPALYYQMSTQVSSSTSNEMSAEVRMNEEWDIHKDIMDWMSSEVITQPHHPTQDFDWDTFINDDEAISGSSTLENERIFLL